MIEKRLFQRIKLGIPCLVYSNSNEYMGVIDNISENGVAILVNKDDMGQVADINDRLYVTGLDKDDVVQFYVDVRRIEERDSKVLIGTHVINSGEIRPFVHEKRLKKLKDMMMDHEGVIPLD